MLKNSLLCLAFIVSVLYSFSQNTDNPYSIFGPGEIQAKGFGRSVAMGGAGIGLKSENYLNNLNPASYTGIDSLHFIYEIGMEGKESFFKSQGKNQNSNTANIKYLAFGFRFNRWWAASLGVVPFSHVGYNIRKKNYIEGLSASYYSQFTGSGGISQFYISNALKITKNLSVGANVSYMFGSLIQNETLEETGLPSTYSFERSDYMRSFYFDYGLLYSFKKNNTEYSMGLTYSNRQNLKSEHHLQVLDEDYTVVIEKEEDSETIKVPMSAGVGFAVKNGLKYTVAADYQFQKWSDVEFPNQLADFADSHKFSLGVQFKPWKERIANKFYQNWIYRFGGNFSSSYLKAGENPLYNKSISFGFGSPIWRSGSYMNVAFELGRKGTSSGGQIREDYLLLHLNFSMNEIWFVKNKYQ